MTTITGPGAAATTTARPNFGGALHGRARRSQPLSGLRGQTTLTVRVDCGGGSVVHRRFERCSVHGASIDLRDDAAPDARRRCPARCWQRARSRARGRSRTRRRTGAAACGPRELLVDGAVAAGARRSDCSFALRRAVPARRSRGRSTLDTTRLADGEHEVTLVVTDATLANRAPARPVHDHGRQRPGARGDEPRRGSTGGTDACYGDDGTWTGANLTFDAPLAAPRGRHVAGRRRRRASVYTPGAEDAGHRLRFRVRASNAEGTARGRSRSRPLACPPRPRPTATPDPGADRRAESPPVVVAAPPAPGAPAAAPAGRARLSVAFAATGRPTVTLRWGERRKVTGTLVGADGRARGRRARRDRRHAPRERGDGAAARPRDHGRRGALRLPPARGPVTDAHVHERREHGRR